MRGWIAIMLIGCTADSSGLAPSTLPLDDATVDTTIGDTGVVLTDTFVEDTTEASVEETIDTAIADVEPEVADDVLPETPGCPVNSVMCTAGCRDIMADPKHCGACEPIAACRVGGMCAGGFCTCQPGLSDCSGICVDTKGHVDACGGCGLKCGANQRCSAGVCVPDADKCPMNRPEQCPSGDGRTSCFNSKRDPMHCGGCAIEKRCESDQVCADGSCKDYVVGVGCKTCPCSECEALLKGSRCCLAPPGSAPDRVFCVDGSTCPMWLPP